MKNSANNKPVHIITALSIYWIIPILIGVIISLIFFWSTGQLGGRSINSDFSFSSVIKSAAPAVVNISTERKRLGSGVIMSENGHIVTNHHVISDAGLITVSLTDGRTTTATLLGSDIESDIAILKVRLDGLHSIPVKQDLPPEIGDIVLAIGNPFGVGQAVTQGIISAKNRSGLGLATFEQYIQTDAAINPGNSGGALINAQGYLIGINSAFLSHAEGAQGISFAIPVAQIKSIMHDIITSGGVTRGYLGVKLHQLNKETASFFNLQHTNGLVIVEIDPDSPASQSKLQTGDVILGINNQSLSGGSEALHAISALSPNSTISLSLYRSGKKIKLTASLASRSRKAVHFH